MTTLFIPLAITLLGLALLYAPWVLLKRSDIMSSEDFKNAYPRLGWVRWAFPVANVAALFSLLLLASLLSRNAFFANLSIDTTAYFIGTIFATVAIINGLFNLITGICPVPANRKYLYAYTEKSRTVGLLQLGAGMGMVIIIYWLNSFLG